SRWDTAFGRRPPPHLSRQLLFRTLAYRLQTDRWGELDSESRRLLDRSGSPEQAGKSAVDLSRRQVPAPEILPCARLGRGPSIDWCRRKRRRYAIAMKTIFGILLAASLTGPTVAQEAAPLDSGHPITCYGRLQKDDKMRLTISNT